MASQQTIFKILHWQEGQRWIYNTRDKFVSFTMQIFLHCWSIQLFYFFHYTNINIPKLRITFLLFIKPVFFREGGGGKHNTYLKEITTHLHNEITQEIFQKCTSNWTCSTYIYIIYLQSRKCHRVNTSLISYEFSRIHSNPKPASRPALNILCLCPVSR